MDCGQCPVRAQCSPVAPCCAGSLAPATDDSDLKALLEVVRPKAEVQQRAMRAGMSPAELVRCHVAAR